MLSRHFALIRQVPFGILELMFSVGFPRISPKIEVPFTVPVRYWRVGRAGTITEMNLIEKKARSLRASIINLFRGFKFS